MFLSFTKSGIFIYNINIVNGFKSEVFLPKYCTNIRFPLDMLQEVHISQELSKQKICVTEKHGSHSVVN